MEPTSNVTSLSSKLKAKTQQDREQVADLTRNELQQLGESLRQQSAAELRTTEDAIKDQSQRLKEGSLREMETSLAQLQEQMERFRAGTTKNAQETSIQLQEQMAALQRSAGRTAELLGIEMKKQAESAGKTWVFQVQAGVQGAIRPIQATMDSAKYSAEAAQRSAESLAESLAKLETSAQATRAALIRTTAFPLLVALLTLLAICGIAWGVMRWQYQTIQAQAAEIAQQKETLKQLPRGVTYYPESKPNGGKPLLILPKGVNMTMTCGDRPCVLLPEK